MPTNLPDHGPLPLPSTQSDTAPSDVPLPPAGNPLPTAPDWTDTIRKSDNFPIQSRAGDTYCPLL
jgi:hypothetical protein